MPYKDEEKRKRVNKDSQRKRRGDAKGVTGQGVTETVPECYVQGITGKFKSLPERPRFVTLSDGQVLDRSIIVPGHASGDFIQRMRYCNESAYNFKPNVSSKERVKELIKESKCY